MWGRLTGAVDAMGNLVDELAGEHEDGDSVYPETDDEAADSFDQEFEEVEERDLNWYKNEVISNLLLLRNATALETVHGCVYNLALESNRVKHNGYLTFAVCSGTQRRRV